LVLALRAAHRQGQEAAMIVRKQQMVLHPDFLSRSVFGLAASRTVHRGKAHARTDETPGFDR
jgi:hypothetical protein